MDVIGVYFIYIFLQWLSFLKLNRQLNHVPALLEQRQMENYSRDNVCKFDTRHSIASERGKK